MAKKIFTSITQLVGNTPLVELTNYEKKLGLKAKIYAKLEYFNPESSVKDRIALNMLETAEKQGLITPEKTTIVETTSGNTGIAVAAFAAAKGYKFVVYIQDEVSIERKQVIKAFGAKLINLSEVPEYTAVLNETGGDFVAGIKVLKEKVISKIENGFFIDQVSNPANPEAHYNTTAKEIWNDTDGELDIFVACAGTGGTITGTGKFLKEKNPSIKVVGVQPPVNDIIVTGVHNFTDVVKERVPQVLNKEYIDDVVTIVPDNALNAARLLAKTDGILVGISSGAALSVATDLAKKEENTGKEIVVILPDTGLRYLTTNLFSE
ncbi:MAG: cysteine synthase family protein [Treponema sp.]|nr:cysteine synthase family protein [Treponema sp.]